MHVSHGFTPQLPSAGHINHDVACPFAPVFDSVPFPRRWLASMQSPRTDREDRNNLHADQKRGEDLAVVRVPKGLLEQGSAVSVARSRSPQQNAANASGEFDANTGAAPEHVVGQSPSDEHQNTRLAAGGEQWTETWSEKPNGMIPILPVVPIAPVNTLLVSNVSRRLSQEDVLRYWPRQAYNYDLLYLAYEARKRRGSGWLFINFESQEDASDFREEWHDQAHPLISKIDKTGILRPLQIDAAKLQGFMSNVAYWQLALRRSAGASFVPAIFIEGRRVDFWQYVEAPNVPFALSV